MLKYIALGTEYKEYFNYDGKPLPIRPLSTYELDEILVKAVEGVSPPIFNSIIKLKLNILDEPEDINIDKESYKDFLKYYNEVDYWIVYHAMKDFQDEDFSFPDFKREFVDEFSDWTEDNPKGYYLVKKMKFVHDISRDVMSMTSPPEEKLIEVLTNTNGKVLASMVHRFHQPLVSEAWKLTPLQTSFILHSRPEAPYMLKTTEELPGIKKGNLEEITQQLREMGYNG